MRKTFRYLLVFLLLVVMSSQTVFAEDFISAIFEPFAGVDIARTYSNPAITPFIDAILMFTFLFGIARISLGNMPQFQGKGGTLTISMFSLILAIAFEVWAAQNNFYLGEKLGPLAAMIFVLALAFFIFRIFRGFGIKGGSSSAFAFVFLYSSLAFLTPELFEVVKNIPFIWGIMNFLFLICLFMSIGGIWKKFRPHGSALNTGGTVQSQAPDQRVHRQLSGDQERLLQDALQSSTENKKNLEAAKVEERLNRRQEHIDNRIIGELGDAGRIYKSLHEHLQELVQIEEALTKDEPSPSKYKENKQRFEKIKKELHNDLKNIQEKLLKINNQSVQDLNTNINKLKLDDEQLARLPVVKEKMADIVKILKNANIEPKHAHKVDKIKAELDTSLEELDRLIDADINICRKEDDIVHQFNTDIRKSMRRNLDLTNWIEKTKDNILTIKEIKNLADEVAQDYQKAAESMAAVQKKFIVDYINPSFEIEKNKEKLFQKIAKENIEKIEKEIKELIGT